MNTIYNKLDAFNFVSTIFQISEKEKFVMFYGTLRWVEITKWLWFIKCNIAWVPCQTCQSLLIYCVVIYTIRKYFNLSPWYTNDLLLFVIHWYTVQSFTYKLKYDFPYTHTHTYSFIHLLTYSITDIQFTNYIELSSTIHCWMLEKIKSIEKRSKRNGK